jgi:hypothetical protein
VDTSIPLDVTLVVTAVQADPSGNGTTVDVRMPIVEGF